MANPHPQFPNPTIVEALCDLQIVPSESSPWKITRPAPLLTHLNDDFPDFETVADVGVKLTIGPGGPTQQIVNRPARLKFSSEDKTRLVQVTETSVTFNFVARYPGWETMKASILKNWGKIISVVRPRQVTRVGLRYINKIPRTGQHSKLRDWLKATDHIPQAAILSVDPFFVRTEARSDEHNTLVVTVGIDQSIPASSPPALLFDIDRACLKSMEPDSAIVAELIHRLHEDVWSAYEAAMTSQLHALLNKDG